MHLPGPLPPMREAGSPSAAHPAAPTASTPSAHLSADSTDPISPRPKGIAMLLRTLSILWIATVVAAPRSVPGSEHTAERAQIYTHPQLSMTVLEATISLPGPRWQVIGEAAPGRSGWEQFHISSSNEGTGPEEEIPHRISALRSAGANAAAEEPFQVRVRSWVSGEVRTVGIDPRGDASQDGAIFERSEVTGR